VHKSLRTKLTKAKIPAKIRVIKQSKPEISQENLKMHFPKQKHLHFLDKNYPKTPIRYRAKTKEKSTIRAKKIIGLLD